MPQIKFHPRLLCSKGRKTTVLQFDNLLQLRRSLLPRIRETVKTGAKDYKVSLVETMASLKKEAAIDMSQAEMDVRAARRRVNKDMLASDKKQRSPPQQSTKNPDDASTLGGQSEPELSDLEEEEEEDERDAAPSASSPRETSKAASLCSGKSRHLAVADADEDDDLFRGKFARKASLSPGKASLDEPVASQPKALADKQADDTMILSDELQEMLAEVVSKYLLEMPSLHRIDMTRYHLGPVAEILDSKLD